MKVSKHVDYKYLIVPIVKQVVKAKTKFKAIQYQLITSENDEMF